MKRWGLVVVIGAGFLTGSGCSHTRPDTLSAQEHRAEAARHGVKARQEAAQYDPSRTQPTLPPQAGVGSGGPIPLNPLWTYNPTDVHRYNAEQERAHARAHLRAADQLEQFEGSACKGVSLEERSACPLLTPFVKQVRETPRGVVLDLKQPAERDPLLRRMRCHWAFARTRAFNPALSCPLYEREVELAPEGAASIAVEGASPAAVEHIRADLRELYLGRGPPAK